MKFAALVCLTAFVSVSTHAQPTRPQPGGGGSTPREHQVLSATSKDGLTWTRDAGVRLSSSSVPCAINDGDERVLLYVVRPPDDPSGVGGVSCAISTDGTNFKIESNFHIEGLSTLTAADPSIVKDGQGKFRLYYLASDHRGDPAAGANPHKINYALSDDGVRFRETGTAFEYDDLVDPDVFHFKGKWFMYVFGKGGTLIATSPDGKKFTYAKVMSPPHWGTTAPLTLPDGRLRLYAFEQRVPIGNAVGSFVSTDGLNWTAEAGQRLKANADEQITDPFVIPWRGGYKMYFKISPARSRTLAANGPQNFGGPNPPRRNEPRNGFGQNPPPPPNNFDGQPAPQNFNNADGPWNRDVIAYRVSPNGEVTKAATFERAGVPTIARLKDGRLIVAHQHFPENDRENFDKVAVHFSSNDGKTWTAPQVIQVAGLPEGMRFPFDPTLVPLPDGRVRLYFTGNMGRTFQRSTPAIHSAISQDGVNYTYETGVRFAVDGRAVIDCAVVLHQGVFHLFAPDNGTGQNPGQRRGNEPAADRPREGVGYHATSKDGLNFTRVDDVQIEGRRSWLGNAQSDGKLITFYGTGEGMSTAAGGRPRGAFWMATSADGKSWKQIANPAIGGGDPGAVKTQDGGLLVVITGESVRRGSPRGASTPPARDIGSDILNPQPRTATDAPSSRDVAVHRVSRTGTVEKLATFAGGGAPTIARLKDGRIIVAHQHFPQDGRVNHEQMSVRFSGDDGSTWTAPQVMKVAGLPDGMPFAFDPTLVPLPDGRVRLYFTGNIRRESGGGSPAIYSAISTDGVNYTFEPGQRFEVDGRIVIDCAAVLHQGVFHLFVPDNGVGVNPSQRPANEPAANRPREGVGYHATSKDGLKFTRVDDVQIEGRRRWLGNAQSDGKVITFYGTGEGLDKGGGDRSSRGFWMATSADGHDWKLVENPSITGGDPGAVNTRDGGLLVVITTEPRHRTPGSQQRSGPQRTEEVNYRSNETTEEPHDSSPQTTAALLNQMWSRGQATGDGPVKLKSFPLRIDDIGYIIPLGNMQSGHTTPSDHLYFVPKGATNQSRASTRGQGPRTDDRDFSRLYDVVAAADGFIVALQWRPNPQGGQAKYDPTVFDRAVDLKVFIEHSAKVWSYVDHLVEVDAAIMKHVPGGLQPGPPAHVRIPVKAGQVIGKIGNQTFDFALIDTATTRNGFVRPEQFLKRDPWKPHTVDPFDYVEEPLRGQLLAKNARKVPPFGGRIDYDIDGKLVGNWFEVGTGGYAGLNRRIDYWVGHLSIVYHHLDPKIVVISIGNYAGRAAQFWVNHNQPDPATIGEQAGVVKYELIHGQLSSNGQLQRRQDTDQVQGTALAQLLPGRKLKFEAFPGKTGDQVNGFTGDARIYER